MARYYFHVRDGDKLLEDDEEGEEFPDLDAVRHQAIESAREILSEAARSGIAGRLNHQVEVTDETGRTIFTIPVGHATGTETQT